jgi:2,5-furandicarboxylate decarboxylase 1
MSFREYIHQLKNRNQLIEIDSKISKEYEIPGVLKKLEPQPVLFQNVWNSNFPVIGNLFCTKSNIANYFNIPIQDIIPTLVNAINNRSPCRIVESGPCQEIVDYHPDLDKLPILKHYEKDGGNYISSGVVISKHPIHGQNLDFHRCMQISKNEMAIRIIPSRHMDVYLQELKELDIAVCVGVSPSILISAAISLSLGVNELEIANALENVNVIKTKSIDVFIPAETEFVLEGTVYLDKTHSEGPFVDLTGTYDIVRQQPIFVVKTITHRRDAIWQALLPGALEHKLLMGMPREPTIYSKVNEVVKCMDVNISPGGCSWLHAIVQIDKQDEEDGKKAIKAAFSGHRSCKHVYVVDKDINIYDPLEVEWAMATRFQGDKDMIILEKERGSSLDPSADSETSSTTKIGFDLTKPLITSGKSFERAQFPDVNLEFFTGKPHET